MPEKKVRPTTEYKKVTEKERRDILICSFCKEPLKGTFPPDDYYTVPCRTMSLKVREGGQWVEVDDYKVIRYKCEKCGKKTPIYWGLFF